MVFFFNLQRFLMYIYHFILRLTYNMSQHINVPANISDVSSFVIALQELQFLISGDKCLRLFIYLMITDFPCEKTLLTYANITL